LKEPWIAVRNDALLLIAGLGHDDIARKIWKKFVGYHRRSLAETAFSRWKQLFGGGLTARKPAQQQAEVRAKTIALNRMTNLGMPKGEWVLESHAA
jgi:hypothetical protein